MNTFKEQCVALRKQDRTLTEIVKITGRSKSSVYAHIYKLPLSKEKKAASLKAQGERVKIFALRRRGVSARKFTKFVDWNESTVSLVSHFLFDGEIKQGHCSYHNRNQPLLRLVEKHMESVYHFAPKRYYNHITGVSRISYFNVELSAYMKQRAEELLQNILTFPKELKRVFLRSFFDDEGCIDFRPSTNTRRVRGYQKNIAILKIVRELLYDFDIDASIQLPNEVIVVYKDNLSKFEKEIGFSQGVRINGKRSNSIWKKSLEKRKILRRAIASYKPLGSNGVHRTSMVLNG